MPVGRASGSLCPPRSFRQAVVSPPTAPRPPPPPPEVRELCRELLSYKQHEAFFSATWIFQMTGHFLVKRLSSYTHIQQRMAHTGHEEKGPFLCNTSLLTLNVFKGRFLAWYPDKCCALKSPSRHSCRGTCLWRSLGPGPLDMEATRLLGGGFPLCLVLILIPILCTQRQS